MACGQCGDPNPEYFTDDGVQVCRVCYFGAQAKAQEQRALDSVEAETGTRPQDYKQATAVAMTDAGPTTFIIGGIAGIVAAVVLGAGEWIFLGSIHPIVWGAVLLAGFASLGRGLQLRPS